jgi:hypothetical protein
MYQVINSTGNVVEECIHPKIARRVQAILNSQEIISGRLPSYGVLPTDCPEYLIDSLLLPDWSYTALMLPRLL